MVSSQAWTCCRIYHCWDSVVILELRALVCQQSCCVHLTKIQIRGTKKSMMWPACFILRQALLAFSRGISLFRCVTSFVRAVNIEHSNVRNKNGKTYSVMLIIPNCSQAAQDLLDTMIDLHKSHTLQVLPRRTPNPNSQALWEKRTDGGVSDSEPEQKWWWWPPFSWAGFLVVV